MNKLIDEVLDVRLIQFLQNRVIFRTDFVWQDQYCKFPAPLVDTVFERVVLCSSRVTRYNYQK